MIVKLYLPGKVVPKKRPVVNTQTKQGTLPKNYRKWKDLAIIELGKRWEHIQGNSVIKVAHIQLIFGGAQNGDPDNLAGSVLDALVQSKILKDDKIENIPLLLIRHDIKDPLGCKISLNVISWYTAVKFNVQTSEDLNNVF